MKRSRFTEGQIIGVLREHETIAPMAAITWSRSVWAKFVPASAPEGA